MPQALEFVEQTRIDKNLSYNSVNVLRCALSAVIEPYKGTTFGEHPDTVLYMRGVFNQTPRVPKYEEIWDLNTVLEYLKKISPARKLPLKSLTLKVATLFMVVTGQRAQTLSLLNVDNCQIQKHCILFVIQENVKQSRVGSAAMQIKLKQYAPDPRLCIVNYMKEYLKRTKDIRSGSQLFISFKRPFAPVQKGTIAQWIKWVLGQAGINTSIFQGHSVRSAACSKAARKGVPLNSILKQGGWRSASVFQAYYNKPLTKEKSEFMTSVLSK